MFKYQVGDMVCVRAQVAAIVAFPTHDAGRSAVLINVVERIMQECPGGVQLHYAGRFCTPSGVCDSCNKFLEHELMPAQEAILAIQGAMKAVESSLSRWSIAPSRPAPTDDAAG